jgi:hypothetical protein
LPNSQWTAVEQIHFIHSFQFIFHKYPTGWQTNVEMGNINTVRSRVLNCTSHVWFMFLVIE